MDAIMSLTKFDGAKAISLFELPELYYAPQLVSLFGQLVETQPSATEIVETYFIKDSKEVYGYYSGIKALNDIHGTTQVPATIEIKSNKVDEVSVYLLGYTKYIIYPAVTKIDSSNHIYLELLDIIEESYDYFEEDIQTCITSIIEKCQLTEYGFNTVISRYSARTKELIKDVFA